MSAPPLPDVFGNYAIKGILEVQPPQPVSWWPATPGWLVLAGIALLLLARWALLRWRRWQRDRYRREALARLAGLSGDAHHQVAATAVILKSAALAAYPRREIASLSGNDWLGWLEARGARFSDSSRRLLAEGQYHRRYEAAPAALEQLVAESSAWLRNHEAPRP